MNKKIKLSFLGSLIIVGLFAGVNINTASAETATTTCNNAVWSALLSGTVTPNGTSTQAWFEWGKSTSLGNPTPKQTFSVTSSYSQTLSPLAENTTYYWRAMAQNKYGTAEGTIKSFSTSTCSQPTQNQPPVITLLGSNPTTITVDQAYNDAGATAFDPEDGNITYKIVKTGYVNSGAVGSYSLTYSVSDSKGLYAQSISRTVNVNPQVQPPTPKPSVSISADNDGVPIPYGGSTTIRWSSTNATSCIASDGANGWAGPKGTSGNFPTGNLISMTAYNITCSNSAGSTTNSVVVSVGNQPIIPTVFLTGNSSVPYNGSTTINWGSNNATSCIASGGSNGWAGTKSTSGSFPTGNLTSTATYNMICYSAIGTASKMDSLTVTVGGQTPPPPNPPTPTQSPTASISATPGTVAYNGTSTITWTSTNATSCSATGGTNGWAGTKSTSGSFPTGSLASTITYNITCSNSAGSAGDSIAVNVGNPPTQNLTMSGTITPQNANCLILPDQNSCNVNLSWATINPVAVSAITKNPNIVVANGNSGSNSFAVTYPSTTFYLYNNNVLLDTNYATANCSSGTSWNGNICQTITNNQNNLFPSINFSTDQNGLNYGNGTTLTWNSSYTTSCYASDGVNNWAGSKNTSGSFYTGALYSSTTFTLTCSNNNNSLTRNLVISVNSAPNNNYSPIIPTQYYNPTYIPVPTPTYIPTTTTYVPTPAPTYIPTVTTASPATNTTIQRTVYVNNGTGERSLVMLTIDGGGESIVSGERRRYHVTWQNISNQNLTDVVLRVLFPASMNVETATGGSFNKIDNTLTLNINRLNINESGEMFITASTKTGLIERETIIVVANLVFTDNSNRQNDAVAYAIHRIENNMNLLGANALFSGTFLFSSIFGWLLLLILILLIILLVRYLNERRNVRVSVPEPHY